MRQRIQLGCILAVAALAACSAQESEPLNAEELSAALVEPGSAGASDVTFRIRTDTAVRSISPYIYGVNEPDSYDTQRYTMVRSGGNRWTAYNWVNNASNAGSDWCFQNDGYLSSSNTPGEAIRSRVSAAASNGAAALVTIPIVDYVAADKNGGCSNGCNASCDVRSSGSNYLNTRFRPNRPAKGAPFSNPPSSSTIYQDEFVNWLKSSFPSANIFFALDNEPGLWATTHAPVHPYKVGYDELVERNINYAKAIKSVWPEKKVTGFVGYGWSDYASLQDAPDAAGKGEFVDYYLRRMREAEASAGRRLVDVLDLHWYPEVVGQSQRIIWADTSNVDVDKRVQAPRSLWDPNYAEDSWIAQYGTQGPIKLIPRMKAKIDANYPGTGLAFSEWTFGGGQHISGAIASADALGIFGREGVTLASYWPINSYTTGEEYTKAAMRMYRNYDGQGGRFGDTSVSAVTSDVEATSVYASVDSSNPSRMVIVAINKRRTAVTAGITVAGPQSFTSASVYALTGASTTPSNGAALSPVATNAFRYTMPPLSVTVIVPTGNGTTPPPPPPPPPSGQPTFTSSVSASPATLALGGSATISANVQATTGALTNGVVDIQVYNSAGAKVGQQIYRNENIATGQSKAYSFSWTAPAVAGRYVVKLGVFGANWKGDYHWNNRAAEINVEASTGPSLKYNFEANTQGFRTDSGSGLSLSTARAFSGSRSLAVQMNGSAASTSLVYIPNPVLPAGKTVTFHIWIPTTVGLTSIQPYVADKNWSWTGNWKAGSSLTAGAWNTVTVAVPGGAAAPLLELGVQISTSRGYGQPIFVDAISW